MKSPHLRRDAAHEHGKPSTPPHSGAPGWKRMCPRSSAHHLLPLTVRPLGLLSRRSEMQPRFISSLVNLASSSPLLVAQVPSELAARYTGRV